VQLTGMKIKNETEKNTSITILTLNVPRAKLFFSQKVIFFFPLK